MQKLFFRVSLNRFLSKFRDSFSPKITFRIYQLAIIFVGMVNQRFTPGQAVPKIKQYCAYQERCHSEVRDKLYSYGLNTNEVGEIVSTLVEENFLNEERFAIHFAGGKFRVKQWGRVKIKYELKQKQVSDYCIKRALHSIEENDYQATLEKLAINKIKSLKSEKNLFIRKRKLQDHLRMKGYETELIHPFFQQL